MTARKRQALPAVGDRVSVEWLDAHTEAGWFEETERGAPKSVTSKFCETVGWVVRVNSKEIVIAGSRSGQYYGDFTAIPAPWAQKIRQL